MMGGCYLLRFRFTVTSRIIHYRSGVKGGLLLCILYVPTVGTVHESSGQVLECVQGGSDSSDVCSLEKPLVGRFMSPRGFILANRVSSRVYTSSTLYCKSAPQRSGVRGVVRRCGGVELCGCGHICTHECVRSVRVFE